MFGTGALCSLYIMDLRPVNIRIILKMQYHKIIRTDLLVATE
jgi:hypothetical protein